MISVRACITVLVLLAQPAGAAAAVFCHGNDGPKVGHCTEPSTPGMASVTAMTLYAGCQAALTCREQVPLVSEPCGGKDLSEIPSLRITRFSPSLVSVITDGPPTPPPNG